MARTWSASAIQLRYWRPSPSRAPRPSLNSGASGPSSPPWPASTSPVRRLTTRVPAALAGAAAASQSATSSARNPRPAGAVSSTSRSPVSPYQPMADPDSSTGGGAAAAVIAVTRVVVALIRLSRSARLRDWVHQPPATGAPDRLTTASDPLSTAGSSGRPGSHWTCPGPAGAAVPAG